MAEEHNTGERSIGLMLLLVSALVVIVVGGGYALWSWYTRAPAAPSRVDLGRVAAASRIGAQEQPAYRELLRQNNARGAQDAAAANQSFVASIPLQQDVVVPKATSAPEKAPKTPKNEGPQSGKRSAEQEKALNEARAKSLAALLARLQQKPDMSDLPTAQWLGGKESGWASWRDSQPGSLVQQASVRRQQEALSATPPLQVVPPYWRGPGEIYTGVNSDNSATPVLGRFVSGPYAGAILKASAGAKLAGDGVVIHFDAMTFKGQNYTIDAYALQDDTLVANVATNVESHYFRRIVLPSILKGIGGAGDLYAEANTEVLSNGFNAVTTRPDTPDGTAVAGVIAGEAASNAANVLNNDASRLPDRTVTVDSGQVVVIQFMRGVYSTDAETPRGASAVSATTRASASTINPAPTAAQLRTQAQARIGAAQQQGEARE